MTSALRAHWPEYLIEAARIVARHYAPPPHRSIAAAPDEAEIAAREDPCRDTQAGTRRPFRACTGAVQDH